MSDIKHLEYCIKLGNSGLESKLAQINNNTYVPQSVEYTYQDGEYYHANTVNDDIEKFRARIKV